MISLNEQDISWTVQTTDLAGDFTKLEFRLVEQYRLQTTPSQKQVYKLNVDMIQIWKLLEYTTQQ
jgi:hypothetical protein